MEIQTVIVTMAALAAIGYLIRAFTRTVQAQSGCGCGSDCRADQRRRCEGKKENN